MQSALTNINKHRQGHVCLFYRLAEGLAENTSPPAPTADASPRGRATGAITPDSKKKKKQFEDTQLYFFYIFKAVRKGLKCTDFPARVKTQIVTGPGDKAPQSHCCPSGRGAGRKRETPKPCKKKIKDKKTPSMDIHSYTPTPNLKTRGLSTPAAITLLDCNTVYVV